MKLFGGLFFTAFFFSLFIFKFQGEHSKRHFTNHRSISSVSENGFDKINFRRSFLSLNESQKVKGLIYKPGELNDYMQRLFGQLIQKANEYTTENNLYLPEHGSHLNHNVFLLMSLQVPMHESSLSHFRRKDPKEFCYWSNSVLDPKDPIDFPEKYYPAKINNAYNAIEKILEANNKRSKKEVLDKSSCMKFDKLDGQRRCTVEEAYEVELELRKKYCKNYTFKKGFAHELLTQNNKKDYDKFEAHCSDLSFGLVTLSNTEYLRYGMDMFDQAVGSPNEFVHCEDLHYLDEVNQLLFSNDYKDVGILMFNAESHPHVFASGNIYDFDFVLNYGTEFLFDGFYGLYNYNLDHEKGGESFVPQRGQECFHDYDEKLFSERVKMIRGAWAGKYNSGNLGESCRMFDPNTEPKYKKNDINYINNLAKVFYEFKDDPKFKSEFGYLGESLNPSLFHKYLPKDSLEYRAYQELINNVYNGVNDTVYISQVLKTNYGDKLEEDSDEIVIDDNVLPEVALSDIDGNYVSEVTTVSQLTTVTKENEKEEVVEQTSDESENEQVNSQISQEHPIIEKEPKKEQDLPSKNNDVVVSTQAESEKLKPISLSTPKIKHKFDISLIEESMEKQISKEYQQVDEMFKDSVIAKPAIEFPVLNDDEVSHVTFGTNINIRKNADYEYESVCANTRDFGNGVFKLKKYEEINGFYKVIFEPTIQGLIQEQCGGQKQNYIHKSVVRKRMLVEDGGFKYLIADRVIRDRYGMSKSIEVGAISASESKPVLLKITKVKPIKYKGNTYMWYEFLYEKDGKKRWFYDHMVGEPSHLRSVDEI